MSSPLAYQLSPYITQLNQHLTDMAAAPDPPAPQAEPPISSALLQEAAAAIKAWKAKSENQALLQDMRTMPFDQLRASMHAISKDPDFKTVFDMATDPAQASPKQASSDDNRINSITFGVSLDITAVVGVVVGLGMAINPHDLTQFSVYLLGAIPVGIEEEAEISFDLGFESNTPDELSAVKVGAQATIDGVIGASATVSVSVNLPFEGWQDALDPSNWSVTVAESDGEGAGVAVFGEARLVIINDAFPLVAQPAANAMFMFQAVWCGNTMDDVGKDEIYLSFIIDGNSSDEYRYPWWSHFSISEVDNDAKYPDRVEAPTGYWNAYRSVWCNDYVRFIVRQGDGKSVMDRTFYVSEHPVGGDTIVVKHNDDDQLNHVDYKMWIARKV